MVINKTTNLKAKRSQHFMQFCYEDTQDMGHLSKTGNWLCCLLRAMGRGFQCQWMNS